MVAMRIFITEKQVQTLKRSLQGKSGYQIARELGMDPPGVYASIKTAKKNFLKLKQILAELEALGFSEKINLNHNGE